VCFSYRRLFIIAAVVLFFLPSVLHAQIQLRGGAFGLRMEPYGSDAEDFSTASWGGGGCLIVVPENMADFFAAVFGFDVVNMLSQTYVYHMPITLLRVEQQTNQWYSRFFFGGRLGHQGHGIFRPYAGANISVAYYKISTDVVIPDDSDYQNEIRQDLRDEGEYAFGFDLSAGLEINFNNKLFLDMGGRYLKSFNVPQQLGADSVEIHPEYFQIYLGLNWRFI